jgi:hypothetical protein
MNIQKGDYQGLLNEISIVTEKTFTEDQSISLLSTMQVLGWSRSHSITMAIRHSGYLPKNIYGHVLCLLEEEIAEKKRNFLEKKSWEIKDEDRASNDEFGLTMKCISLISKFPNSKKMLTSFSLYMETAAEDGKLLDQLKKAANYYENLLNAQYAKYKEITGLVDAGT